MNHTHRCKEDKELIASLQGTDVVTHSDDLQKLLEERADQFTNDNFTEPGSVKILP